MGFLKPMRLKIKVIPRSSKNEVVGLMADGTLKIKLTAAPVEGKANAALIKLLSDHFRVPKKDITIVQGEQSKLKLIEIAMP